MRPLIVAALAGLAAGCVGGPRDLATAAPSSFKPRRRIAAPALQPDTVVVQQLRIDRPEHDPAMVDRLWRSADDRFLNPELRAELARQGLRVGRLPDPPPAALIELLDEQGPNGTSNQMLAGHPVKIEMTAVQAERQLFRVVEGALRGETLRNAQGYLLATPALAGDRRVRLTLEPRMEMGEPQPRPLAGASLGAMEWRFDRETREFPELRVEAELGSGEYLVVGPLDDRDSALGGMLFRKTKNNVATTSVLVLRVVRPTPEEQFLAGQPDPQFGGGALRQRTPAASAVRGD